MPFHTMLISLLVQETEFGIAILQRIQYAKTKSDVISKADGTFVPREKRKRHDDKGKRLSPISIVSVCLLSI